MTVREREAIEQRRVYEIARGDDVDVYPCGSWRAINRKTHRHYASRDRAKRTP